MSSVTFIGEHLFWGNLGHSAVVVSFIASILACLSYVYAERNPLDKSWAIMAKYAFHLHSLAVLTIIASLFKIIYSHYFEYHYAWQHSRFTPDFHLIYTWLYPNQVLPIAIVILGATLRSYRHMLIALCNLGCSLLLAFAFLLPVPRLTSV